MVLPPIPHLARNQFQGSHHRHALYRATPQDRIAATGPDLHLLRQLLAKLTQAIRDLIGIQAQAEAEAIKIQAQAINSQGGADYVSLKAIEKWNGVLPTTMTGSDANILIGLK